MPEVTIEQLRALKPRIEEVEVPEIGDGATMFVREMRAIDALAFSDIARDLMANGDLTADRIKQVEFIDQLLLRTICTAAGKLIFRGGEDQADGLDFEEIALLIDVPKRRHNGFGALAASQVGVTPGQ